MSNTQFAFLMKSAVPTAQALQRSIDALGFDLKLDPQLDFFKDQGFSPCVLNGQPDIGFEISSVSAHDILEDDENFQEIAGANDWCIGMSWGGSMHDCASVMIVSCAVAKDFGAVISYEGDPADPVAELIDGARNLVEELRAEPQAGPA